MRRCRHKKCLPGSGRTGLLLLLIVLLSAGAGLHGSRPDPAGDRMMFVPPLPDAAIRARYQRPASIPFPADNPYHPAKEQLGRLLFFDPILSGSGRTACATCHQPALAWGDGKARAVGDGGQRLALRSPTLLDIAWIGTLGWDGKFPNLESVAYAPITAAGNMNLLEPELIARLQADARYPAAFAVAFGDERITRERIEQSLATFQRTIVSAPSAFDRWIAGDPGALGPDARRGFALFTGKAGCASCHDGWAFTDGGFHDIGVAAEGDLGRGRLFPNSAKLRHAFKTPTLRNVSRRAPYMHDGSLPDLAAVIDLYNRGGIDRPSRDRLIRPLGLSAGEKADLTAFLESLADDPAPIASAH